MRSRLELLRDPWVAAGIAIYAMFALFAVLADVLAPFAPMEILFMPDGTLAADLPPGAEHLLGTTALGRDIFSQLVHGSRSALYVGLTAASAVVGIGTLIGLAAGYFGGWIDRTLMRIADVAFGIPFLPFVIVLAAFLEPSIWNVVFAMALVLWRDTARVIRAQVMSLRSRAFVEAARITGASDFRILFVHIAPNILPLSFLYGAISVGWAILAEASVSFLGFGDYEVVSWGFMLQDAYNSQAMSLRAYHWFLPPGITIALMVMAGFFISRGFEEILFPRLRRV